MGLIYYLVKSASQTSTKIYFKTIYVIGQENIPKEGPLIICGNHSNQFIDPMMIMNYCEREISFTMAATSFNKKVIGKIAKLLNVIPVYRPEDYKVVSPKKLTYIEDENKHKFHIENLQHQIKDFKNGFSIMIENKILLVEEVLDDKTILIKKDIKLKDLKSGSNYDFQYIPKIDNSTLFKEVYSTLKKDGCICIFPEGTSHDRTDFIELKAGIAHFALGAMSEYKSKNIQIVPVGLNYFNRHEFRSEVIIEFGKPYEVPSELAEKFKISKRPATELLLAEIHSRMKAVTMTAPSFTELRSLLLVRKLYLPPDLRLSPENYSLMCQRFAKGYEKLKEKEETRSLMTKIHKYIRELETTGISDHEVRRIEFSLKWMFKKLILNFILFHVFLILSLPGFIIVFPIAFYLSKKVEKERVAAKAKNPNKIEALDVVSSIKFQYAVLCAPIIISIWLILSLYYYKSKIYWLPIDLSDFSILIFSLLFLPFYVYFVVIGLDYVEKCKQTFYSRFLYLMFPNKIVKLKKNREELSKKIKHFVKKYIGEVDETYKKNNLDLSIEVNNINNGETIRNNEEKICKKLKKKIADEIDRFYVNFNILSNSGT